MSSIRGAAEAGKASNTATRAQRLALLTLSFQTLGIIYSDIGTSPLYTLNGIWPASSAVPPEEDVIGGLSAIIWALTLLPLLKYVFICLRFGTMEGEGGTFALYQGLYPPKRHVPDDNFVLDPLENEKEASTTVSSSDPASGPMPDISPKLQFPLFVWCLFGIALTLADGIFTPAVSVTSTVAGIAVAKPSVANDVIPISIALLVVLFLAQSRGTSQLGFLFAPATFVWLILLAATGIVNIISYPAVFRAFDPSRAIMLFVRTKNYDILAGVLLALTGCEAMFASLGHFNMLSIQLSFSCFVYPSVVLAYLGQGARLVVDGETALANLFYATIPGSPNGPLYWIMFVFGILATFIASQTLITASFSLIQQLIKMHVLPPLRIVHTSETHYGQIYIPAVNWILMIVTIIVVATFKDPVKLTNAYGFSVATVMFSTTILIAVQMKFVKHLHVLVVLSFFLVFGFLDGLFWGAALKKVPQGAWVPLIIGIIMITIMLFWSWAKGLEDSFDGVNRRDLNRLILRQEDDTALASEHPEAMEIQYLPHEETGYATEKYFIRDNDGLVEAPLPHNNANSTLELARLPTCAVFHRMTTGKGIPHSFTGFIRQWPALPRVVIFLSVNVLSIARVPEEDRFTVNKVSAVQGFYTITYRLGYRESLDMKVDTMIKLICDLEIREDPQGCAQTVQEIKRVSRRTTHIVPHYVVTSKGSATSRTMNVVYWCRSFLIEELYRRLATMFPETAN